MTREEAAKIIKSLIFNFGRNNGKGLITEALNMAIRSLEAWDKVFDELYENIGTTNTLYSKEWNDAFDTGCQFALLKVNKHLKEVENG